MDLGYPALVRVYLLLWGHTCCAMSSLLVLCLGALSRVCVQGSPISVLRFTPDSEVRDHSRVCITPGLFLALCSRLTPDSMLRVISSLGELDYGQSCTR